MKKWIFILATLVLGSKSIAQEEGAMLSIEYNFGLHTLKPAFYTLSYGSDSTVLEKTNDRFFPKQVRIKFGKFSDNAFYEMDLTGILYYLADYTYYLATEKHMKGYGIGKLKNYDVVGMDASILNMDIAFGGDVKFGPHFDVFGFGMEKFKASNTNTYSNRVSNYAFFAIGFGSFIMPSENFRLKLMPSYLKSKDAKGFEFVAEAKVIAGPLFGGVNYKFRSVGSTEFDYMPNLRGSYFGVSAGIMIQ